MSWAFPDVVDLYLGATGVAVDADDVELWHRPAPSWDAALQALAAWRTTRPQANRVRVWLGAERCRPFLVPALDGTVADGERQRIAAALAPGATGLAGPCRIWLDRARHAPPVPAAALDETTWTSLHGALRRLRLRAVSVRPWWSEALRVGLERLPVAQSLALHDGATVTLLAGAGGGFDLARSIEAGPDADAGRAAILRVALSAELDEARGGRVLLGPFDAAPARPASPPGKRRRAFDRWTRWQEGLL